MTKVIDAPKYSMMRLIFEYEGDQLRLVMHQPVDISITEPDFHGSREGYYLDTRDAAERTLSRVPIRSAFLGSLEVFPEHAGEPISRVDVERPRGAFTVISPVPQETSHFSVVQVTAIRPHA